MVQYTFLIYIQLDSFIPPAKKNIALFCCLFIKSKKTAIGKDILNVYVNRMHINIMFLLYLFMFHIYWRASIFCNIIDKDSYVNKALHIVIAKQYLFQFHWQQFDEQYTEAIFREDRDL